MAMNNRDRMGRAFDLLSEGLHDLVDEVITTRSNGPARGQGRTSGAGVAPCGP